MDDQVQIQVQDHSGYWRTMSWVQNNTQRIIAEMRRLKEMYPEFRVRAADKDGRMVDMLG
jgi:hypothetical protein